MRTKTSNWFETKVKYEKTMEDGCQKHVTEQFVVEALSFTEAEARITEEMKPFVSGKMQVVGESIASYKEITFSDDEAADKWYKTKVSFITIDEKTSTEKKQNVMYLVQASDFDDAKRNIAELFKDTAIEYRIASQSETKIIDVYEVKQ